MKRILKKALAPKRVPKLQDEIIIIFLKKKENKIGTISIVDHDGFVLHTERSVFVCSKEKFPTVVYKLNGKTFKAW
jgi:hypothetical protein